MLKIKFYSTSESPKLLLVEHVAPLGVYFFFLHKTFPCLIIR